MKASRSNEIRIIRVYDAPIETVWQAWSDPIQVAQWWGPRGFTLTTHSKDLRAGGSWCYTMHGPDGVDYPNITFYHEVEKYSKLEYDHGANDHTPPLFRVTALFSQIEEKTMIEVTMCLPTPEAAEETRKFIKKAGGDATWDRLAEYLEKKLTGKDIFVINRSFDAPQEKIFELLTTPEHLCRWLPPSGFTMQFIEAEIKPGGKTFSLMQSDEYQIYSRAIYSRIEKSNSIVYIQQFCDQNGYISHHPLLPTWPETINIYIKLSKEGADQTRITLTWEPDTTSSKDQIQTFVNTKAGMSQGWNSSFDNLDRYLLEVKE